MMQPAFTMGERTDGDTLRFERRFAAPVERVWKALVTREGLAAWLGQAFALELFVGGRFELRFNDAGDCMLGRVLEVKPNECLALAWHEESDGVASEHATRECDESLVRFELAPLPNGGTSFVFTHRYIRAGDGMSGLGAGWHAHFDALDALVRGAALPDRTALYEQIHPLYAARLSALP